MGIFYNGSQRYFSRTVIVSLALAALASIVTFLSIYDPNAPILDSRYEDRIGTRDYPRFDLVSRYDVQNRPGLYLSWNKDGSFFVQGGLIRGYSRWMANGNIDHEYMVKTGGPVAIDPESGEALFGVSDYETARGHLSRVDLPSKTIVETIPGGSGSSFDEIAFSPTGKLLAGRKSSGAIIVFDTSTWDVVRTVSPSVERARFRRFAISPNDTLLATALSDGSVSIWNLDTGEVEHRWKAHAGPIEQMAFTNDGRFLVTGGSSTRSKRDPDTGQMVHLTEPDLVRVWAVATWSKTLGVTEGMKDRMAIHSMDVSNDDRLLAVGGLSRDFIRIFDMRNGQRIQDLPVDFVAKAVAFGPNGRYLAAVTDFSVFVWELKWEDR